MKQKVRNQPTRTVEGGQSYTDYMESAHHIMGEAREQVQANADSLAEGDGYWAVDEATQDVQRKVRLMLEKAKQVLTDRQYNAFILVDIKKLKIREAAKVMEINFQRVNQLVTRARVKLQGVYNGLD